MQDTCSLKLTFSMMIDDYAARVLRISFGVGDEGI